MEISKIPILKSICRGYSGRVSEECLIKKNAFFPLVAGILLLKEYGRMENPTISLGVISLKGLFVKKYDDWFLHVLSGN